MKISGWSFAAAVLPLAAAAPPFVLQNAADGAGRLPDAAAAQLPDLMVEDFQSAQQHIAESLEQAVEGGRRLVSETFNLVEEALSDIDPPHKFPIPPFIDLGKYTVKEIVLRAGEHDEELSFEGFGRKLRRGAFPGQFDDDNKADGKHHEHDPKHLPLHKLAHLARFSPEFADSLDQDDITFLAPDDWALTPPHKRPHPGAHISDFETDEENPPVASALHPFHQRELSPKGLRKLAETALDGDEDDEKKKELFRKIIAYIGKYHTLPTAVHPRDLADHSTVASSLKESRVRVSPSFSHFPFPHPTLRFNVIAETRGPLIKAKNGFILLISNPLLPPLSPLNQLFLTPQFFSGFTNAVQKIDLDKVLLPSCDSDGKGAEVHSDAEDLDINPLFSGLVDEMVEEHKLKHFTVFAPTNAVFKNLPPEAVALFHSPIPFAKKVLKYVAAYHVSPVAFFSDHFHNATEKEQYIVKRESDVDLPLEFFHEGPTPPPHVPEHPPYPKANVTHYVLPTLLTHFVPNATIKAAVFEYRLFGHGPKRRSIVIFPSVPPKKHAEDKPSGFYSELGDDHHGHHRPRPVLGDKFLLPPPPPHHEHDGEDKLDAIARRAAKEAKKVSKAIYRLFA
ncbi:hypothetical protein JCM10213v2_004068 [Rhodosporidiobolus nylandii]